MDAQYGSKVCKKYDLSNGVKIGLIDTYRNNSCSSMSIAQSFTAYKTAKSFEADESLQPLHF